MAEEKICQSCSQRHSCQEVYRQLGKAKGPSVVSKVIVAFVLPIVVFIASLAAFEKILAGIIKTKPVQTAVGLLLAISVTFGLILIVRAISLKRKVKTPGKTGG